MDHPIMLTPQDIINTVLAVCGAIIEADGYVINEDGTVTKE